LEVETPSLSNYRDVSVHIRDFCTEYIDDAGRRRPMGLISSPEHHMKRLLASGWGDMFQICRFFRNGESTDQHNPEFTGVEWYQTGATYRECMDTTEGLVKAAASASGTASVHRGGMECALDGRFERLTVRDAVRRHAGVDVAGLDGTDELRTACERAGERCAADDSWEDMFFRLFLSKVEPRLGAGRPVFLHDYPHRMAALSKIRDDGGMKVAERFELYVCGVELCNGFTELRDAVEQRARFERQIEEKKRLYGGEYGLDEPFLSTLPKMPACAGNALGLDRLVMLLLNLPRLADTMPFPLEEC
jgi:lysyl-tRNA synthetase class 2